SLGTEEEVLAQRIAGLDDAAAGWRQRLESESIHHELPALPRAPEPPIAGRVAVETLRRARTEHERRIERLRGERETLANEDPDSLRAAVASAEEERRGAERRLRGAEDAFDAASARRSAGAELERTAAEAEAAANRAWREAST